MVLTRYSLRKERQDQQAQFASPGAGQQYGGAIMDYGYEVMWKRPKAT